MTEPTDVFAPSHAVHAVVLDGQAVLLDQVANRLHRLNEQQKKRQHDHVVDPQVNPKKYR